MNLLRIDGRNYREHQEKIALVHGIEADQLAALFGGNDPDQAAVAEAEATLGWCQERCREGFGAPAGDAAVWLVTGRVARALLGELPVHGCTLLEGKRVTLALTWEKDLEMLGRLFGHEWCHAFRLMAIGFPSHSQYVRYLSDPVHWLYEETVAIATEKWLYPHLSWEAAAGFSFNPLLTSWAREGFLSTEDPGGAGVPEVLDRWLGERPEQQAALIYYLAYRLCCHRPVTEHLPRLVHMPARDGLLYVCRELADL